MKHKKFRSIIHDNKKKVFKLEYTSGLYLECPYSALGIKLKVLESGLDKETGNHTFYFILEDGTTDYVPFDQPLSIANNADYVKEQALYEITKEINFFIKKEKISKNEIARRLNTSTSQLARLLDTTNYKKEMSRLIEIAVILNYTFSWEFHKKAV
jgi:hypothetical protein